jgi:hypothetical protein
MVCFGSLADIADGASEAPCWKQDVTKRNCKRARALTGRSAHRWAFPFQQKKEGPALAMGRGAFDMMLAGLPQARNSVPHELGRPVLRRTQCIESKRGTLWPGWHTHKQKEKSVIFPPFSTNSIDW